MQANIPATSAGLSRIAIAMVCAATTSFVIGAVRAAGGVVRAHGMEKIVAFVNVCFAVPLAVFGALHVFAPDLVIDLVPAYMPWRLFWIYLVGVALLAASLSMATNIGVRWSGLLFGAMMFLFVALIHLPGAVANIQDRFAWTIVFRETSFGGGAWLLAATAADGWAGRHKTLLIAVGRVCVMLALLVFGLEHFLHPTGLPGVPLRQAMPSWVPGGMLIDYLTGAALLTAGASVLLGRRARTVVTLLGGWLLLLVLVVYGPFMVVSLLAPSMGVQVQGTNYFADTLLFAGVVLALAKATSPRASAT